MERTSDVGYREKKGLADKKLRWKGTQWERSRKLKGKFYSEWTWVIRLCYMDDNAVLMTREDDMDLTKVVEKNKAWLETIFEFVTHCEENLYLGKCMIE